MTYRISEILTQTAASLAGFVLVFAVTGSASGQQNTQLKKPVSLEADKSGRDDPHNPFAGVEEEMRAKRAIKFAEKEHQDNIERARDLSSLVKSILDSFKQNHALAGEELKRLEKVEKLAKGIRRAAGGSDDETNIEKPPTDVASAVELLGKLSKSLREGVERTPKHVVSAAVIDEANVLLELIRIVRTLPPKI